MFLNPRKRDVDLANHRSVIHFFQFSHFPSLSTVLLYKHINTGEPREINAESISIENPETRSFLLKHLYLVEGRGKGIFFV